MIGYRIRLFFVKMTFFNSKNWFHFPYLFSRSNWISIALGVTPGLEMSRSAVTSYFKIKWVTDENTWKYVGPIRTYKGRLFSLDPCFWFAPVSIQSNLFIFREWYLAVTLTLTLKNGKFYILNFSVLYEEIVKSQFDEKHSFWEIKINGMQ